MKLLVNSKVLDVTLKKANQDEPCVVEDFKNHSGIGAN